MMLIPENKRKAATKAFFIAFGQNTIKTCKIYQSALNRFSL